MTRDEIWTESVEKSQTETMPEHYSGYQAGYFDAALNREVELASLRAERSTLIDTWVKYKAIKDAEIASLLAKLEAVPVESIREAVSHMRGYAATGQRIKMYRDAERAAHNANEIDRWLAGLK